MNEKIRTGLKVFAFMLVIIIVGTFVIGYQSYQDFLADNPENKGPDELFVKEGEELIPLSKIDRKGASNPALEFRNKSDPDTLVWYFDHDGKILAYNSTFTGNISADTGFFNYLGDSTKQIVQGWFVDLDVNNTINTTKVNADDWTNVTVTESQVSDLSHTTDTDTNYWAIINGFVSNTTSETTNVSNITLSSVLNCDEALETNAAGRIICGTDATGTGGAPKNTSSIYLFNDTDSIFFNETKLNLTIDDKLDDVNTTANWLLLQPAEGNYSLFSIDNITGFLFGYNETIIANAYTDSEIDNVNTTDNWLQLMPPEGNFTLLYCGNITGATSDLCTLTGGGGSGLFEDDSGVITNDTASGFNITNITIQPGGKIGVGDNMTVPEASIHINTSGVATLLIESSTQGGTDAARLQLTTPGGSWYLDADDGAHNFRFAPEIGNDFFFLNAGSNRVQLMADSAGSDGGKVGIGDESPDAILEISGSNVSTDLLFVSSTDNDNGNVLKAFNNSNVEIGQNLTLNNKGVIYGNNVSVRVQNSTDTLNVASGSTITLTFDTELYDPYNMHTITTNPDRLTAPMDGFYVFGGMLDWEDVSAGGGGFTTLNIRVNGAAGQFPCIADHNFAYWTGITHGATPGRTFVTCSSELKKGEYIQFLTNQNSGGALDIKKTGELSPVFWMTRING